jgi:predicted CxxxxCH...CXXCH cytochrome family protein
MVVDALLGFVAPELHVNGTVESDGVACTSCHGAADGTGGPAPPRDTLGNVATSARGVGAHQTHLAASNMHAPIACGECHVVPTSYDAPGHADDALPAELSFGPLARARGATPSFDGVGCSNVACHDGGGGSNRAPLWTVVDGTQAACGTCHALPPPSPHPAESDCVRCHGAVVNASQSFLQPALHVNGRVDVSCVACHGDDESAAPPRDLDGNVDASFPGVGAHRTHLDNGVACSECHVVPDANDPLASPGHIDEVHGAELVFGPLANSDGVTSSFNGVTCATYCHGGSAFIQGGSNTEPAWTIVDGSEASCGSCHGVPPPAPHPTVPPTACGGCHPFSGLNPLNPLLHVNGVVERP